jgi:Ca2+-binding RTX toxin-like protein
LDNDNPDAPTDIGGVNGVSVLEDAAAGAVVTTLSTTDPNDPVPGDSFTYQLIGNSNFELGGTGRDQILVAQGAQFDSQAQPTQSFQVKTTDALGHSFVKDVTINVTSVDQPPTLDASAALDQVLGENGSLQVELTALGFNGALVGVTAVSGASAFSLAFSPGEGLNVFVSQLNFSLTFNPQDFESPLDDNGDVNGDNVYDYTISISDGLLTTTKTFHFTVTDVTPETLNGSSDADQLIGGSDVDKIFGFAGNDILNGMAGNDVLTGGAGKDWLTGGAGTDSFNFKLATESVKGTNHDVIMDFHRAEDHIDLSNIDAKSKTKTVDDHFKFIGAKPFHHKAGELHFIKKAGFLLVEGDMDGNGRADFQIEVHGITKLGAIDFNL